VGNRKHAFHDWSQEGNLSAWLRPAILTGMILLLGQQVVGRHGQELIDLRLEGKGFWMYPPVVLLLSAESQAGVADWPRFTWFLAGNGL